MTRFLVAQAVQRSLFEGEGAPVLVGALAWTADVPPLPEYKDRIGPSKQEGIALIAKITLSYSECDSASSAASLALSPEPLSLDCLWESADEFNENANVNQENATPEDIWYPSDFVPHKSECDILLSGHAFGDRPLAQIEASIRMGDWSREFVAWAPEPSVKIPLRAENIRTPPGLVPGEPVGALPTPEIPVLHHVGFDFSVYNQASKPNRVARISPDAVIELHGLSERSPHLSFQLPNLVPHIFVERSGRSPARVDMRCDTLWLDTDRELCVLVFRGTLGIGEGNSIERLIVSIESAAEPRDLKAILKDLARGVFTRTVLPSDLEEGSGEPPMESGEVWVAKYEAMEESPEPTISIEKYAQISAELAEQREPRGDCLKKHGFNEDSFMFEERGWLEKMGNAAMEGDGALAVRYGELFVAAQDRLAGPGEGRETIDEYAALKVEMEETDDPDALLRARSLSFAAWMRQDRRWSRDALANRQLKADLERRIAAYRIRHARRMLEENASPAEAPEEDED